MLLDYLFENVPNEGFCLFDRSLRAFDIVALSAFDQLFHNEGFEKLYSHFFGKSALIEFEFGTYDDNRTSRIVYTLAEEVLTETPLLAAEHTRKGFKLAVGGSRKRLAAPAVVDERVHRFLQHTLFVFDYHLGRAELHHSFKTVVAVYNSSVQIVEVGRSESAAVELNHRTEFGREHGKDG